MTDIQPYQPHNEMSLPAVDSWVPVLASVGDLATKIAGTEFVPKEFRGKPAAVAAAILFGREVDLPPMTALKNTYVVHGIPDLSAEAQRALVLAAGHDIGFVETTATRCIMQGRRAGVEDWTQVAYTMDEARQSGDAARNPNYKSRPQEMLVARATTRLCSMIFPDVIGGFTSLAGVDPTPIVDEPEPPEPVTTTVTVERTAPHAQAAAPSRAKAATPARKRKPAPSKPKELPPPPPPPDYPDDGGPALPGDEPAPEPEPETPTISAAQSKKLHATLRELGVGNREDGLSIISDVLARPVESTKTLSQAEASIVIDTLTQMVAQQNGGAEA